MLELSSTSHFAETLKLLDNDSLKSDGTDAQEFQKRIKTFILGQKWVGKPFALSPPVCARFGWKCCGPNKLKCASCSATLCTSLPETEKSTSYDKCVSEVLKCLKSAHRKHCPWPLAPCPENFYQMAPVRKEIAFKDFIFRLESLLLIETYLPAVKDAAAEALALSDGHFKALCEMSHISESPSTKSAILLAVTGWRREPSAVEKKYITCVHCQRTVGVWFYSSVQSRSRNECTPKEEREISELSSSVHVPSDLVPGDISCCVNNTAGDECNTKNVSVIASTSENCEEVVVCKQETVEDSESQNQLNSSTSSCISEEQTPAKKRKLCLETVEPFDSLYEHRPWCIWIRQAATTDGVHSGSKNNMQSHSDSDTAVPGYKVFVESLLKNICNSDSSSSSLSCPTREQLSEARELLMTWSSPV